MTDRASLNTTSTASEKLYKRYATDMLVYVELKFHSNQYLFWVQVFDIRRKALLSPNTTPVGGEDLA